MKVFLKNSLLGIIGVVLATIGIMVIYTHQGGKNAVVSHAATGYNESWQATQLYQFFFRGQSPQKWKSTVTDNHVPFYGPALGVAKWQVTGTIGSTSFTETWDGPDIASLKFPYQDPSHVDGRDPYTQRVYCDPQYDNKVWLASCETNYVTSGTSSPTYQGKIQVNAALSFIKSDVGSMITTRPDSTLNNVNIPYTPSNGTACVGGRMPLFSSPLVWSQSSYDTVEAEMAFPLPVQSDQDGSGVTVPLYCGQTTSAYQVHFGSPYTTIAPSNNMPVATPDLTMTAIPLQWTVSGTIND